MNELESLLMGIGIAVLVSDIVIIFIAIMEGRNK